MYRNKRMNLTEVYPLDSEMSPETMARFADIAPNKHIIDNYNRFADVIRSIGIPDEGFIRQLYYIYMDGRFCYAPIGSKNYERYPGKAFYHPMDADDYNRWLMLIPKKILEENKTIMYFFRTDTRFTDSKHYELMIASFDDIRRANEEGKSRYEAYKDRKVVLERHSMYDYDNLIAAIKLVMNVVYNKELTKTDTLPLYSFYVRHHSNLKNSSKYNVPFKNIKVNQNN